MTFPRAGELRHLRRAVERTLTDVCTIRRYSAPTQGAHGEVPGSPTDTAGVPCRVANGGLSDREQVIAQQMQGVVDWAVTLAWDADVTRRDQIIWTDPLGRSHTLEVKGPGVSSNQVQRRLLCSEVGG